MEHRKSEVLHLSIKVENVSKMMLPVTISKTESVFFPPRKKGAKENVKTLTKTQFETPGIQKLIRAKMLRVVPTSDTGDASLSSGSKSKSKQKGGNG